MNLNKSNEFCSSSYFCFSFHNRPKENSAGVAFSRVRLSAIAPDCGHHPLNIWLEKKFWTCFTSEVNFSGITSQEFSPEQKSCSLKISVNQYLIFKVSFRVS